MTPVFDTDLVVDDACRRVLVVGGEPFWQGSATGLTMSSLFRGWPKERLACLYASGITPERTVCEQHWRLAPTDLRCIRGTFGRVRSNPGMTPSKPGGRKDATQLPQRSGSAFLQAAKRLRKRLAGQSVRDLDVYSVPQHIWAELSEFNPQVIYSTLGSNPLLHLVTELGDQLGSPVVPHFMDDWPPILYQSSMLRNLLRRTMHQRLGEVLARSCVRLVISDAMANEYTERYGGLFIPFMNAVEPGLLDQPIIHPPAKQTLRLVYVGGLHLNRWRSLQDIAAALMTLAKESLSAEAIIYTQSRYADEARKLNIPPVMRFGGSLNPTEIPAILRDADILIHVEGFDKTSRAYTRCSISTKIPESMCAARPLLAYGPQEIASIRYVQDSGAGLAVTEAHGQQLSDSLRQLLSSPSLRAALGKRGHEVASRRHNAELQRAQFRSVLQPLPLVDDEASRARTEKHVTLLPGFLVTFRWAFAQTHATAILTHEGMNT